MLADVAEKALAGIEAKREDLVVEAREEVVEERRRCLVEEARRGEKEVLWQRRKAGLRGIAFFQPKYVALLLSGRRWG